MIDWQNPKSWIVLVVDDEPDNLEVITLFLKFSGAVVKTASNGSEALEVLKTFKPNLILLDLSMPKIDGWEVKRVLHANPETRDIWTIALTAHAMPKDKARVREAGFNGYLTKPISLPTLRMDLQNANFTLEPLLGDAHGRS